MYFDLLMVIEADDSCRGRCLDGVTAKTEGGGRLWLSMVCRMETTHKREACLGRVERWMLSWKEAAVDCMAHCRL